ncbi:MAG: hypothetical protein J5613_01850 [Alphaproteobacteria bacterium]|nr:hypothetical protein [Alphaproteobacteria bacterium]
MLGKIKKIFFSGMFCILYISFIAQLVYILGWIETYEGKFVALATLSLEWFLLIAARYLSKRSAAGAQHNAGFTARRH